jgi:hypothetical protein
MTQIAPLGDIAAVGFATLGREDRTQIDFDHVIRLANEETAGDTIEECIHAHSRRRSPGFASIVHPPPAVARIVAVPEVPVT